MTDPAWIHLGIEAAKLAMADRDAHLTDPAFRDIPVERLLDPVYAAELAARIDPRRAARPPNATNPRGGGTIYLATVDADGNAVSLIESNYRGFGSGVVDPTTGIHYQDRGSYCSLDADHANVLVPGKRTLHTLLPGMLFRAGEPGPWVVAGSMGGDAQPQIHAQLVSALVDGGVDVATGVAAPRWYVEPGAHFEPPVEVSLEPRHVPGDRRVAVGAGAPGHARGAVRLEPGTRACHRAGRRRTGCSGRVARGRHRPAQRRAPGRLVGGSGTIRPRRFASAICDTPLRRWQAALTRRRHRPCRPMGGPWRGR